MAVSNAVIFALVGIIAAPLRSRPRQVLPQAAEALTRC